MGNQRIYEIQQSINNNNNLPWIERMDIISSTPLPFSSSSKNELIHNDLKREVIFYNTALEAVQNSKIQFSQNKIPFTRPIDYYTEMIKSDDHMKKVKDRLLYESKKINAYEQRKSNKENKLRSKVNKQNAMDMKIKEKKDYFQNLDRMKQNNDEVDDDDKKFNRYFNNGDGGDDLVVNPRRIAANRKYGFGGGSDKKKGHFKSVDKKSLNDFSDFKRGGSGSGGNKKRPGKRAREAKRQRRK